MWMNDITQVLIFLSGTSDMGLCLAQKRSDRRHSGLPGLLAEQMCRGRNVHVAAWARSGLDLCIHLVPIVGGILRGTFQLVDLLEQPVFT